MIEEWKDIKGYEGLYQVSNLGRVKSLDRLDSSNHKLKGSIRKFATSSNGYVNITLFKDGKRDVFFNTPFSSRSIYTKPRKQTTSKPY